MSSGAIIIRRQNRYMRVFADADATSPGKARRLEELGLGSTWIFRRMVARGVFVAAAGGAYYMNESEAEGFVSSRRTRIVAVVVLAIAIMAVILVLNGFRGAAQ